MMIDAYACFYEGDFFSFVAWDRMKSSPDDITRKSLSNLQSDLTPSFLQSILV